jgi:hypothetical protein
MQAFPHRYAAAAIASVEGDERRALSAHGEHFRVQRRQRGRKTCTGRHT